MPKPDRALHQSLHVQESLIAPHTLQPSTNPPRLTGISHAANPNDLSGLR